MELALFSGLKTKAHASSRRGFSLLEFAIVLGVMGVILGALWGVVSVVREHIYRTQTGEQVVLMVGNIRDYYTSHRGISTDAGVFTFGALTDYLLKNNVMLSDQIRNRAAGVWLADHPWGAMAADGSSLAAGGVSVGGYDRNGAADNENFFTIRLDGLKRSSCLFLASSLSGSGMPERLDAVRINGAIYDPPVSPDSASISCVDPAGAANRIELVYFLRKTVR